jgi:hypothetical protein
VGVGADGIEVEGVEGIEVEVEGVEVGVGGTVVPLLCLVTGRLRTSCLSGSSGASSTWAMRTLERLTTSWEGGDRVGVGARVELWVVVVAVVWVVWVGVLVRV